MTNPTSCGSDGLPISNFTTTDGGSDQGVAKGDMPVGTQLAINGSTDLSSIIVGPDGAFVQTITYEDHAGIARNSEIYVYGQGPKGMGSGSLDLAFFTANGEHTLSLTSSTLKCHTDIFDDGADITAISWSST